MAVRLRFLNKARLNQESLVLPGHGDMCVCVCVCGAHQGVLLLRLRSCTHHAFATAVDLAGRAVVAWLAVAMLTGLAGMALVPAATAVVVITLVVLQIHSTHHL
jgi:hypothetical protein